MLYSKYPTDTIGLTSSPTSLVRVDYARYCFLTGNISIQWKDKINVKLARL
jgi:hypothetical protein